MLTKSKRETPRAAFRCSPNRGFSLQYQTAGSDVEGRAFSRPNAMFKRMERDYAMPGFNRTGPAWTGPMTGRGRGLCRRGGEADDRPPVGDEEAFGPGRRRRRRVDPRGERGAGWMQRDDSSVDASRDWLQRRAAQLSRALADIEEQLGALESRVQKED